MEELLQIGLGLFGGLALFLYGMNLMSNNLQEAAGERMRAILAAVTKNPLFWLVHWPRRCCKAPAPPRS